MAIALKLFPQDKERIRNLALSFGFDVCGFAKAQRISDEAINQYADWLNSGKNDHMEYMSRNCEVRNDPRYLLETAKTVMVMALNYYPRRFQNPNNPQFSYYAYGEDYHKVLKRKMKRLVQMLQSKYGGDYRMCVDSAPIRERYWAREAGIGFIGRNNQLIIPERGSYFFIGILLTSLEIDSDAACTEQCLDCGACVNMCPGNALQEEGALDAKKCISNLTIEYSGELGDDVRLRNHVYGCDVCQQVCPHNRDATPTTEDAFSASDELLHLKSDDIRQMDDKGFDKLFSKSAVKRCGLAQLQRNLKKL